MNRSTNFGAGMLDGLFETSRKYVILSNNGGTSKDYEYRLGGPNMLFGALGTVASIDNLPDIYSQLVRERPSIQN